MNTTGGCCIEAAEDVQASMDSTRALVRAESANPLEHPGTEFKQQTEVVGVLPKRYLVSQGVPQPFASKVFHSLSQFTRSDNRLSRWADGSSPSVACSFECMNHSISSTSTRTSSGRIVPIKVQPCRDSELSGQGIVVQSRLK